MLCMLAFPLRGLRRVWNLDYSAHPDVDNVGMLGLQKHVDLTEGGDRKAFLLLLHLQLLQGNNLTWEIKAVYSMWSFSGAVSGGHLLEFTPKLE